jgi:hypothetical protein
MQTRDRCHVRLIGIFPATTMTTRRFNGNHPEPALVATAMLLENISWVRAAKRKLVAS